MELVFPLRSNYCHLVPTCLSRLDSPRWSANSGARMNGVADEPQNFQSVKGNIMRTISSEILVIWINAVVA